MQQGNNREIISNNLLNPTFWQAKPGVDVVKAEVAKGNDPSQMNANSMDPVVLAINAGAPTETITYLLDQKGNDVNKITHDSRTYIFWAASR
jgi:ankyrin repeat protein